MSEMSAGTTPVLESNYGNMNISNFSFAFVIKNIFKNASIVITALSSARPWQKHPPCSYDRR